MGDLDVFDSNVWKYGLTNSVDRAAELVTDVRNDERTVVLNAYVFQEVVNAFQRELAGRRQDRALTGFSEFVWKAEGAKLLDHDALPDMNVRDVRTAPENELIGKLLGCQAKDAPLVVLAVECRERWPYDRGCDVDPPIVVDVHTADEKFADAVNSADRLGLISAKYVDPR